jgi:hypothetical protein
MGRCAAVKKKGSANQCTATALKGHSLCGTHMRAKTVQIWKDVLENDARVVKCQSIARRWLILHRCRLAGPGVLKRKSLANDDDLMTCEESNRQHPFEYFAFIENGKTWWFDFKTIWIWSLKSLEPSNPYTKVPLTTDTRKRLKEMWSYRNRHLIGIPLDPEPVEERIRVRWNFLCQTFVDNGFVDVSPGQLIQLSKPSHIAMWKFIREDLGKPHGSLQVWCDYMLSPPLLRANSLSYVVNSLRVLMRFVTYQKEPYITIFSVMSAIYRC